MRQNATRRSTTTSRRLKMQKIKNIKNLIEINLNERSNDQIQTSPVMMMSNADSKS